MKLFRILFFLFLPLILQAQSSGGFGFRRFETKAAMDATTVTNTATSQSRRAYVHENGYYYYWNGTIWVREQMYYTGYEGVLTQGDSILLGANDSLSLPIYTDRWLNFPTDTNSIILRGTRTGDDLSAPPYLLIENHGTSGDIFGGRIKFVDSLDNGVTRVLDMGTHVDGTFMYNSNQFWLIADTFLWTINRLTAPNVIDSTHVKPGGLRGTDINQMSATVGQALVWDGTTWTPGTVSGSGGQTLSLDSSIVSTKERFALTISGENTVYFDVDLNTDQQDLTIGGVGPDYSIDISNGADVDIKAGSGIVLSESPANALVFSASDSSPTNEIQRLDTFEIVSNVLRASLLNDGVPFSSVNLSAYLDNTDGQVLSIDSSIVGSVERFALSISGGNTVYLDVDASDSDAQTLSWNGSNGELTISGGNTVDLDGTYLPISADNIPTNQIAYGTGTGITSSSTIKVNGTGDQTATTFRVRAVGGGTDDGFVADSVGSYGFAASNYFTGSSNFYGGYYYKNGGTGDIVLQAQNSTNNTASDAILILQTIAGAGDPYVRYVAGSSQISVGVDNSDSDIFKIDYGASLDATYAVSVNSSNLVGIGGAGVTGRALAVTGEMRISDLTSDTPTRIVGADADGDMSAITLGSGFAITAGTLNYTETGTGSVTSIGYVAPAAGVTISGTNPVTTTGTWTFALANDLAAVEGLSGTGIAVRTASDTWTTRSLIAPAAGFTITDNDGVSGNPTFVLADDLAALEAQSDVGIVTRTASNTYAQRTILAGYGVTISDGDGISGNPQIGVDTLEIGQFAWAKNTIPSPNYHPTLTDRIFHNGTIMIKEDTLHHWYHSGGYNNTETGLYIKHNSTSTYQNPAIHIRNYGPGTGGTNQNVQMMTMELDSLSAPSSVPFVFNMNYVDNASAAGDNTVFNMGLNMNKQGASYRAGQPSALLQFESNYAAATSADQEIWFGFNPTTSGTFRPLYMTANRVDGSGSVTSLSGNTIFFSNGAAAQNKGVWTNDEFIVKNPSTNGNLFLTLQGNGTGSSVLRMRRPTDATNYNALSIANSTTYLQLSDSYLDVKLGADVFSMDHANYGNAIISARYNAGSPNDTLDFGHYPGFGENYASHSNYRFTLSDGAAIYFGVYGNTIGNYGAIGQTNANDIFIHTGKAITTTEVAIGIDRSTGNVGIGKNISNIGSGAALQVDGHVSIENSGTASELRLFEPSGSGSNYVGIKAQAMSTNYTYTWPVDYGTNTYVLTTDGSGGLTWAAAGGSVNIYNSDGNIQDGGTIVDVSGNDPIILALDNAGGETNRILRMTADYAADDATTYWLQTTTGSDSLYVTSYDDGLYIDWKGITGTGEGFVISSNTKLDLRADSILMSTVPAKNVLQFITGLYGNTLSKIEGTVTGQILVWDETNNYWEIGTASGGVSDGDYGDITVSSSGTVWNIDAGVVGNTELASSTGGIYKGSGNIASGAVSTVANTSSYEIEYNGGNAALLITDNSSIILGSDDGLQTFGIDDTQFYLTAETGNTNTVQTFLTNALSSSGTAATGLGLRQLYQLESSTTNAQNAAAIDVVWSDATHASRTGDIVFNTVAGAASLAEAFRIGGTTYALTATASVSNTNTVNDRIIIKTNSSGTASTSFGGGILFQGETTTTDNQDMARITAAWTTATHASKEAKIGIQLGNNGGALTEIANFNVSGSSTGELSLGSSAAVTFRTTGINTGGTFTIGNSANQLLLTTSQNSAAGLTIANTSNTSTSVGAISIGGSTSFTQTSGTRSYMIFDNNFSPGSGTAIHNRLLFSGTINQTGGANGIVRAVYDNPTLTAVADYRSFQTDVNTANAKGFVQTGASSTNNFVGGIAAGTTSTPNASAQIDIVSTTKGLGIPSMTDAQRDAITSPREGLVVYTTDQDALSLRDNGIWKRLPTTRTILKTADETVNNSSTYQADDHFVFTAKANKKYVIKYYLYVEDVAFNGSNGAMKLKVTAPSATTVRYGATGGAGLAAAYGDSGTDITVTDVFSSTPNEGHVIVTAYINPGVSDRTVTLEWAQITADASDTKILEGSFMEYEEIN